METEKNTADLLKVLHNHAVPDPKIVGKLPKGNTYLDFVGHADITRILIEIDPHWRLVPIAWENGRPAMHVVNGMATMWFEMSLLGQARLAIGTAKENSPDLDKVLYGDALRNGAMRFGIGLSLWTKQEWDDLNHHQAPAPASKAASAPAQKKQTGEAAAKATPTTALSNEQVAQFNAACEKAGLDMEEVIVHAGIEDRALVQADLAVLRAAFKELAGK